MTIPGGTLPVPRLGFGGAGLAGGPSRKHSQHLLETAFEHGIRHFDVAPSYGLGGAEDVLGEFAARHRHEITITTKFGIARPQGNRRWLMQWARAAARPIVNRLPFIKRRLLAELSRRAPAPPDLGAGEVLLSLETSLRALRTERIDLFLLHEVDANGLRDELIGALERAGRDGKIGAWGIGSARRKIDGLSAAQLAHARALQFEWSPVARRRPDYPGAFLITHQAIAGALAPLTVRLADPAVCRAWSHDAGLDLADRRELARAILASALAANPGGIVLFWSGDPDRLRSNALALDARYQQPGQRLLQLAGQNPATA